MSDVADQAMNRLQAFMMTKAALAMLDAQGDGEQVDAIACTHLRIALDALETFIAGQRGLTKPLH